MSTLIFPNTPTHLDTYVDPNQATWQYDSDGPYWNVITSTVRKAFSGVKLENTSAFNLTSGLEIIEFDTFEFNIDNYYQLAAKQIYTFRSFINMRTIFPICFIKKQLSLTYNQSRICFPFP